MLSRSIRNEASNEAYRVADLVSSATLRSLGDKSYDRRKVAALEIERVVKQLVTSQSPSWQERVLNIINMLTAEYVCSPNPNLRKGGVFGLAAVSLGLGASNIENYLPQLIQPVLKCFDDPDSRVRYYSCEAQYNIAKTAGSTLLYHFVLVFSGLCKLCADADTDVKNGAQLLNTALHKIVLADKGKSLDMASFVPALQTFLRMSNPYVRQLLLGWIDVLDSSPNFDTVKWLSELLEGLFDMLSDKTKEIRQATDRILDRFLEQLKATRCERTEMGSMIKILVKQTSSPHKFNRLTAISWLHAFVNMEYSASSTPTVSPTSTKSAGSTSTSPTSKRSPVNPHLAAVLEATLTCLTDTEKEIRDTATRAHDTLLKYVRATTKRTLASKDGKGGRSNGVDPIPIFFIIINVLESQFPNQTLPLEATTQRLRWASLLVDEFPEAMASHAYHLRSALLPLVSHTSDQVVQLALSAIARLSRFPGEPTRSLTSIVRTLAAEPQLLERRGGLVVRQLSVLLSGPRVYRTFAEILLAPEYLAFAPAMVRVLNTMLLTAVELQDLRGLLKCVWRNEGDKSVANLVVRTSPPKQLVFRGTNNADIDALDLFGTLFRAFSHDPASALSLSLFAHVYPLANAVVRAFCLRPVSQALLVEIDRLVFRFESALFLDVRMDLLHTGSAFRYDLLQALYGVLMLLPQGDAYRTLHSRLGACSAMHIALGPVGNSAFPGIADVLSATKSAHSTKDDLETKVEVVRNLLNSFVHVQEDHIKFGN